VWRNHGWTYGPDGRCIAIPAHPDQKPRTSAVVRTYRATVQYGLIWVTLGIPRSTFRRSRVDEPSYRKMLCGPYLVNASGPRIVENFLDVGHFPFVHEHILGTRERPEIDDYEAEILPDGVEARSVRVYQPDRTATGVGAVVAYTYRVPRPLAAYLAKESDGRASRCCC